MCLLLIFAAHSSDNIAGLIIDYYRKQYRVAANETVLDIALGGQGWVHDDFDGLPAVRALDGCGFEHSMTLARAKRIFCIRGSTLASSAIICLKICGQAAEITRKFVRF